jgi:predicted Zn-dependent peptidase
MENFIKTYDCGLRLIVRPMAGFKSVVTSVMVGAGSRDEEKNEHGLSHFVEHMLFKGTTTRTCAEIAATLSGLGVDYNAYTSTNVTCYHTRGLSGNLEVCCDILSDMYFNLKFADEDFKREAEVVVQEIAMRDDHSRLALGELCAKTFFAGTEYGHSIAGTVESVRAFKPQDIYNYRAKHYVAPKTIISIAGDVTVERAQEMVEKFFLPKFKQKAMPSKRNLNAERKITPPQNFVTKHKDTEQQYVAVLFPVMNNWHDDRYAMTFIAHILSGDMSSRLFESVRDKLGLVYSISGGCSLTHLGGYYYIVFSCTPDNTEKVLQTVRSEIERIRQGGVTEDEVTKVKNIKRADTLFDSESVEVVNQRNAGMLSEFNEIQSVEEYLEKINAITANDVKSAAVKYLEFKNAIVGIVGKDIKVKPFDILK